VARVPALTVEKLVIDAVRETPQAGLNVSPASAVRDHVAHVESWLEHVEGSTLHQCRPAESQGQIAKREIDHLTIPWSKPTSKVAREIIPPAKSSRRMDKRPIRSETKSEARPSDRSGEKVGRRTHLGQCITSVPNKSRTLEQCSLRQVNLAMTLARFCLPDPSGSRSRMGSLPREAVGVTSIRSATCPHSGQAQHQA
jgi:site-specific DNA recombinase